MVSFNLALAAGAQRLSNGYGGASAGNAISPAQDIPYRQIHLQASGADAFAGQDVATSSTVYGVKIAATDLQPIRVDGEPGGIKISDIWVAGAGSTLHFFGIPL